MSTPVAWDEIDDVEPRDFTMRRCPQRFAELGDLHAGIDDAVFDLAPLLQWADRDERDGAPAPRTTRNSRPGIENDEGPDHQVRAFFSCAGEPAPDRRVLRGQPAVACISRRPPAAGS